MGGRKTLESLPTHPEVSLDGKKGRVGKKRGKNLGEDGQGSGRTKRAVAWESRGGARGR